MKALSKDNDKAFTKMIIRDAKVLLAIILISSMGIGLTLYAVAKGLID